MKEQELISIIVPIYNASKVIERCVSSICNQTYKNIEIILVDDGSTDDSLEVSNRLASKDGRIKVLSQKNSGVSGARNFGIDNAKGKYIGFVDSDDWVNSDMYLSMYEAIKINNSEIVLCNYIQVYGDKYVKKNEFINVDLYNIKESILSNIISRRENNIMGTCWRMLISKELLDKNKISFDLGIRMSEDMMFMIKCIDAANKICLDERYLYYYYMNTDSATAKFIPNIWEDMMVLIDWCNRHMLDKYSELNLALHLEECITNAIIVCISNSCKKGTTMNLIERMKYCKKLCEIPFVKAAIKNTWKNKGSFSKKCWLQIICIELNLKWIVLLYHSIKHKTVFS